MKPTLLALALCLSASLYAQQTYRDSSFHFPKFELAPDLKTWENQRLDIQDALSYCLGDIPPLIQPQVQIVKTEDRGTYTLERFRFWNGADAYVPGYLLVPKGLTQKAPAVLYLHYHGGEYNLGKDELWKKGWGSDLGPGEDLVSRGYVVCAIDAYAFGERQGQGPDGPTQKGRDEEHSFSKINLWKGRTYWGMALRDERLALNYLETRPEIDPARMGTMGMSMGATRAWWLAAIDDRVKACIPVACLTRYQDLIQAAGLHYHSIYMYVPSVLQYFDAEAIVACIAPRPLFTQCGELDKGTPLTGVQIINETTQRAFALYGKSERFKATVYPNTGHDMTKPMWADAMEWLKKWL